MNAVGIDVSKGKSKMAALHKYGIRVTVINPLFIKQSSGGSIRKIKTGKADAMKIAKYALDNWVSLRYPYGSDSRTTEAVLPPVQSLHEECGGATEQSHFSY